MTKETIRGALAALALLLPALAFPQGAPAESRTLEALINEVRLLRRAIERQTSSAAA